MKTKALAIMLIAFVFVDHNWIKRTRHNYYSVSVTTKLYGYITAQE